MGTTDKPYTQLSAEERATRMLMTREGNGVREVGRVLNRSPGTMSRETDRDCGVGVDDGASRAGAPASRRRIKPRTAVKLVGGGELCGVVGDGLKEKWSPEHSAGTLKSMHPEPPSHRVSHETMYHTLSAMPRGEWRREWSAGLRWSRDTRRSKTRAPDGRGPIAEMQRLPVRPPEVEDTLIPGHWEADLINGTMNRSSVDTLVERTTLMVGLATMPDGTAQSALDGFSEALSAPSPACAAEDVYVRPGARDEQTCATD